MDQDGMSAIVVALIALSCIGYVTFLHCRDQRLSSMLTEREIQDF